MYVARISPEAKRDALQRAFAKARLSAAELAAAAGHELGELQSLYSLEPDQPAASLPRDAIVIGRTALPNHLQRVTAGDGEVLAADITHLCPTFQVVTKFRLK